MTSYIPNCRSCYSFLSRFIFPSCIFEFVLSLEFLKMFLSVFLISYPACLLSLPQPGDSTVARLCTIFYYASTNESLCPHILSSPTLHCAGCGKNEKRLSSSLGLPFFTFFLSNSNFALFRSLYEGVSVRRSVGNQYFLITEFH